MSFYFPDTIIAPATLMAESAVGVIRLSGPQSLSIAQKLFRATATSLIRPRHVIVGEVIDPHTSVPLDQVILLYMKAPASYTGEDVVEFHTHGSPLILSQILKHAQELGARPATAGEFTKRAFLNGKMDLSQAEAVADLISAKTLSAVQNAVSQLNGFLARTISEIRERLQSVLVRIEVGFDFSEEDVSFISPAEVKIELALVRQKILELVNSYETGRTLTHGFKIALVGRPNVGKSSLFNVLLREDRAIVHAQAGTTRDVIEGEILLAGNRVVLMDTAGLRLTPDEIESEGIRRARAKMAQADFLLIVLDQSQPLNEEDKQLIQETKGRTRVFLLNKADLPPIWTAKDLLNLTNSEESLLISAISKDSSAVLEKFLIGKLKEKVPENVHNYVLTKERHHFILKRAAEKLQNIVQNIELKNYQDDVLSDEISSISKGLTEIGGQVSTEDVLDQIFKQFCIGK